MRAKATEPLMVPATATMDNYLFLMVHFFFISFLQMADIPKMVMTLAMTTMASYSPRKLNEMTSLRK